jgi:hypothetical protein
MFLTLSLGYIISYSILNTHNFLGMEELLLAYISQVFALVVTIIIHQEYYVIIALVKLIDI